MKFAYRAVLAAIALASAGSAMAQATATADATASISIARAITVTKTADLAFGRCTQNATGTVVVRAAGVRSVTGDVL